MTNAALRPFRLAIPDSAMDEIAEPYAELMSVLGYPSFGAQRGDWGAIERDNALRLLPSLKG